MSSGVAVALVPLVHEHPPQLAPAAQALRLFNCSAKSVAVVGIAVRPQGANDETFAARRRAGRLVAEFVFPVRLALRNAFHFRSVNAVNAEQRATAVRFVDAGGLLTLCTGRAPISTAWIAKALDIGLPCILYGGAALYDFGRREIVSGRALPAGTGERCAEVLSRFPTVSLQAYGAENIFMLRITDLLRAKGVREEVLTESSTLADVQGDLFKLVLTCPDVDALQECGETVFGASGYHFAFASRHFAEVVTAGAEKGAAARLLAGRLGVPMSHTMGAGDAMTDHPLLKACALAFVPEDAPGALLDIAAFVMPSCENGGLEQTFDHALSVMEG